MASEGDKDAPSGALSMEQSSTSGAKRKRGRPRKHEYPVYDVPQKAQPIQSVLPLRCTQDGLSIRPDGLQAGHTSGGAAHGNRSGRPRNSANTVNNSGNQASYHNNASLQRNSGKDDVLGKHFVGKLTRKIPGFALITVKLKDNQVLKGWVPDENNLRPITPKDDLAPELPMLRPSQVRKRASAILMQAAPPVPIHLEDVTLAKPLQMRRPDEKTIAKHTVPHAPRPYMGSAVLAAVPVSISPSNPEMRTLAKQDTEPVIPQSSVAAVPIKSARPVLVPCKQVDNQNELAGKKSVNEFQKDSESSNETKETSVIGEKTNTGLVDVVVNDSPEGRQLLNVQVMDVVKETSGQTQTITDEIKITSGVGDQPNSANSEQQSSKEPSDITEQSERLKTETSVLKGVDGLKSGASDDVHPAHDEHEMKVDSK
ncbi:uncharacterized protein LOC120641850 isoform X1 [Panicum virgatum]|uniref:Uncharacterized protein n=1 Tax=Panicum virgatum TaxID=38727 RepID=A0A8T0QMH6_PANVG|nr:uncharacterized protein LOC120641850 isoform X1 [Panicum virgatum]XP_039774068.1 uncharacterized protein LOC120641850 isoform X1 [Panicum virgatum]KAG2574908.1 hypothetical protein PVAP13_7KG394600 [Panicum virgatum]